MSDNLKPQPGDVVLTFNDSTVFISIVAETHNYGCKIDALAYSATYRRKRYVTRYGENGRTVEAKDFTVRGAVQQGCYLVNKYLSELGDKRLFWQDTMGGWNYLGIVKEGQPAAKKPRKKAAKPRKRVAGTDPVWQEAAAQLEKQRAEGGDGSVYLDACDVAKLIRRQLKAAYPDVRFSVRTSKYSMGDSVHVSWTDGPRQRDVEKLISGYAFSGFDGMIDLAYGTENWLLPDGTMQPAYSPGTEGSRGCHQGYATDCPTPGAVLVRGGTDHVFCQRELSDQARMELAHRIAAYYGHDGRIVDGNGQIANVMIANAGNEYLPTLVWRFSERAEDYQGFSEVVV